MRVKLKLDGFVLAIIAVVIAAYFFPQWGASTSPIPLNEISSFGVSLIFFFYGLKLSADKLKNGLLNWKLHVLVQLSTFVLFPLLIVPFFPLATSNNAHTIWLAFMFLAALPSTVSSSVVMVSMAKGNIPAAIFNASISGLIGIVVTPLWMGLFLQQSTTEFNLSGIYTKLVLEILLPVLLGILLQRWGGKFAQQYAKQLSTFDKTIILLIIYKSFSESFIDHVFTSVGIADFVLIFVGVITLFYMAYGITRWLSKQVKLNTEDQITAQFCGTKKSLVHGTVFSKILFPASMPVGVILLPLMLFHAWQLFVISIIASKLANQT